MFPYRLYLTYLFPIAFVVTQDGCERTGCSGPWGAGLCAVVRPELFGRDRDGNKRLAFNALRRCRQCPDGWTGLRCQRPCQNMYKQCTTRWEEDNRCRRHRHKTAYFDDNCPLSCGHCKPGNYKLETPIPILAEPLAWLIGKWEAVTLDGARFPLDMPAPYRETLIIKQEKITMFDRPSLNFSARAVEIENEGNVLEDVGFLTSRFGNEDTGYARNRHSPQLHIRDIGLSLNSNTGVNWAEEGVMSEEGNSIHLTLRWIFALYPHQRDGNVGFHFLLTNNI